eukprot:scaffold1996_cov127-Cylindrotheca_fusiformis.AAC.11
MHREHYDGAFKRADFNECNRIVDKIVATVCHECVPKGRFLLRSSKGESVQWNMMDEQSAKMLLHSTLQLVRPVDDVEKKRGRTPSLLRRSVSETTVGAMQTSKKKLSRPATAQTHRDPSSREPNQAGGLKPRRMDVILTHAGTLDPNSKSAGNNQLHVLIASAYKNTAAMGKDEIVDNILQLLSTWNTRFLVQGEDGYEALSKDQARSALLSIFLMRSGQGIAKRSSLPNPPAMALPTRSGPIRQASAPVRSEAATLLNSGPAVNMPEVEVQELQGAAVNQLKKKKARQNKASRIEGRRNLPPSLYSSGHNLSVPTSFSASNAPQRRESTVLGGLDPALMNQLVADFNEADFNDTDGPEPLPPTNANTFGRQFGGSM